VADLPPLGPLPNLPPAGVLRVRYLIIHCPRQVFEICYFPQLVLRLRTG
jgi:hypothetical protein